MDEEVKVNNSEEKKLEIENNEKKPFSIFYKCYLIYIACGIITILLFLLLTRKQLNDFEMSQINNYKYEVAKLIDTDLKSKSYKLNYVYSFSDLNTYEQDGITFNDGLNYIFNNTKITYKLDDTNEDEPFIIIKSDGEDLGHIILEKKSPQNILGLVKFHKWDIKQININNGKGFYHYDFKIPLEYVLYINDKIVSKENVKIYEEVNEALNILTRYDKIPYNYIYEENGFALEPKIKILNQNDEEVKFTINNNHIECESIIKYAKTLKEAKKIMKLDLQPLEIAKKWSMFLTGDLDGKQRGYGAMEQYLIPGSPISKYAKDWAYGIESTWTGVHTLENPPFSVEKVENFEIYTDRSFSCEVTLKKTLHIYGSYRSTKTDLMHERMYFSYDDKYMFCYLVSMQAITE